MKFNHLKSAILIVIAFLSFGIPALAQENYLAGEVIFRNGDTVSAEIDYRNWELNPKRVSVRSQGVERSYSALEIREFTTNNETYVGAIVDSDTSPFRDSELDFNPEFQIGKDTVFLLKLISGAKELYHYRNTDFKDQFYILDNDKLFLLNYKKHLMKESGVSESHVITEKRKFVGQLGYYLSDCKKIKNKLNGLDYKRSDLENLFRFYSECTGDAVDYVENKKKLKKRFGFIAGGTLTSVNLDSERFEYLEQTDYPSPIDFMAGINLEVFLPRNREQWTINTELMFTSYSVDGNSVDSVNQSRYTLSSSTLSYSHLRTNIMFRYNPPIGKKTRLFFNVGCGVGFVLSETNEATVIRKTPLGNPTTTEGSAIPRTNSSELGLFAGMGVKRDQLSLEVRYESTNGMSGIVEINSAINRVYFLAGFSLK